MPPDSIQYKQDGTIIVGCFNLKFILHPEDYSNISNLKNIVQGIVRDKYEKRYTKKEWGRRLSTPPPPMEYDKMAAMIVAALNESQNFSIWQVMFA